MFHIVYIVRYSVNSKILKYTQIRKYYNKHIKYNVLTALIIVCYRVLLCFMENTEIQGGYIISVWIYFQRAR